MNTPEQKEERTSKLTAKLGAAIERAKDTCERLEERTAAAARATDKVIKRHRYEAIGVGLGLGLLSGVLVMRSRKD